MSSPAQIHANQANAQKSCGPKTKTGKQTSSRNHTTHGLCPHHNAMFYLLEDEDQEKYYALHARLKEEHQPQTETECIFVRRMAQHEWLRARALRLQQTCLLEDEHVLATEQFGLYMRYQTTHERAFYKALSELQKLRSERRKEQIGFESQKRQEVVEQRAAEAHNLKKQEFELKKRAFELKEERFARPDPPQKSKNVTSEMAAPQNSPAPVPETTPGGLEMVA